MLNENTNEDIDSTVNNEFETPQDKLIELSEYSTKEINDNVFFTISDIVQKQIDDGQYYGQEIYTIQNYTYANYYTYGFIVKEEKVEEYYLKVYVDNTNNLFLTEELGKEEYTKAKNEEIKEINVIEIQKESDNTYKLKSFSSEDIARRYIKDYMFKVNYLKDMAYKLLEDSYKSTRFKTVEDFKEYIQKNENRFQNFVMSKYNCEITEKSRNYIVLDKNNIYYKIIVYNTLDYKIILDNYTIESEEYVEEYNNSADENKVTTCISKVIKLINEKEYSQVYNYLDSTFKQNNFDTIEKFESYAKSNFFDNNTLTMKSVDKIGEVYSCKIVIKSGVGLSAEEKEKSIIIKLLEGTDFVMSFSVE